MKRQYKQSVKLNGGIAIPLGNNYFYMKGRKHSTGGIDVDKNLEVEDGEIVHAGKKSTKVYSSLPFLNGISPVEKLLGGQNPNKVFAEQERFKDIHGINDDGTMKKKKAFVGTETKTKTNIPAGAKIGLELFTDAAQKERQAVEDFTQYGKFLYNTKRLSVNDRFKEAFKYAKENANIRSHGPIGGSTIETRKKFWESDKDIRQFTDSVAKSHKLDPHVLRNSLSNEGVVDENIKERNRAYKDIINKDKNYILGITGKDFLNGKRLSDAYGLYGVDDSKTYYNDNESMRNLIDNSGIKAKIDVNKNEKHRTVYTLQGKNNAENIIIHSATLKTIQDIISQQKRYKGIPKDSLNDLTLYHFNYGPYAKTPINVAKMRQGRYNAKNYKAMGGETKRRGLYSVTSNGQTKLYSYPSTGSETQNNHVVARTGTKYNNKITKSDITFDLRYNPLTKNEYNTYSKPTDRPTAKDLDPKTFNNINRVYIENAKGNKSNWWKNKVKPWFKDPNNVADTIELASNSIGNLASAIINKKALDNMEYTNAPIPKVAAKLKTNYNINPALNSLREDLATYNRNVDYNTESSQVALNRKRQALTNTMDANNKLYALKENEQTKLINTDKLNQQGVVNENIDAYNSWMREKTNFDNTVRDKRAENAVGFLNNFNLGIQDILTRRENRRKDRKDAKLILAMNPHVNAKLFERFGLDIFK